MRWAVPLLLILTATPDFEGRWSPLSLEDQAAMRGKSWREGCPVPLEALARVEVSHHGYDGAVHRGVLIVDRTLAPEVVELFRALYAARFPIEKMQPVDAYGGDDAASMADNNTSAFNCRPNVSRPGVWSNHAFGRAIDLNPRTNPYVGADGRVLPPEGKAHLKRIPAKGLVRTGDAAHRVFRKHGWTWGGAWKRVKDYQHFEKPRPR